MTDTNPKISVLMPVYNAGKYLRESIDSILNQTFSDFEFLIYNDGSTDDSDTIIKSYKDSRIKYTKNEKNEGYVLLLNKGIDESKGQFIARMDADDISLPNRFLEQLNFLNNNPKVGIVGSWYYFFGRINRLVKSEHEFKNIKAGFFDGCPLCHPTVMMRREYLIKNDLRYDPSYLYAEDHEFFWRCSFFFDIVNMPKVLFKYRLHNEQIGSSKWMQQYHVKSLIQSKIFSKVLINPAPEDLDWLNKFFTESSFPMINWENKLRYLKNKILYDNIQTNLYENNILSLKVHKIFNQKVEKNIKNYFLRNYYEQKEFNWQLMVKFFRESYNGFHYLEFNLFLKFFIKCLIFFKKKV